MPIHDVEQIRRSFYETLCREVVRGNPYLDQNEKKALQSHYYVIVNPAQCPRELAATIYVSRREHTVQTILAVPRLIVFDAGSGYGSESFLFAKLGATVLSVDRSVEQIAIARKRLRNYEDPFEQKLDIHFVTVDLNEYVPEMAELSLTWLDSLLATILDQEAFPERIYQATCPAGHVIITDMNLSNTLFLVKLSTLLRPVGFYSMNTTFSGFLPPQLFSPITVTLEKTLYKVSLLRAMGYFYLVSGQK